VEINPRTCFRGDDAFLGGKTEIPNVYIGDYSDSDVNMIFYGMYLDWETVPESDRFIDEYELINNFDQYSDLFRSRLEPKVSVPR